MFAAFSKLRFDLENSAETFEVLEDIITLRASFLIDHAITGLRIDFDKALSLLRNHNDFTAERDKQERDILVAAIDNLVDFAVAEEYAMYKEIQELPQTELLDKASGIFDKYHLQYVPVENRDVVYAAGIAVWWLSQSEDALITFMTQGDERVRAWHLSHEGMTYRKSNFPPELVPPLEFGCRCFLISNSMGAVRGSLSKDERIHDFNPVFKESLCMGGRIFSADHSYFKTEIPDALRAIGNRLKRKFGLS